MLTTSLDAVALIRALQPDDVHREFVGFLSVFGGTATVLRGNTHTATLTLTVQ